MMHQIRMRELFLKDEITIEEYLCNIHSNIETLYLYNSRLTYIPKLSRFTNLTGIDIRNTNLTKLPTLPDTLEILYVPNNKLEHLPSFPKNLIDLMVDDNKLKYLPTLPNDNINIHYFGIFTNKMMYGELMNYEGSRPLIKIINIVNRFRENYYCYKFGKKIFYRILKRRQLKKAWFDEYFRKIFHPSRFIRLLETYNYDMNEDEYCN
jgi:hypothetical protein